MSEKPVRLLLVEDNEDHAALVESHLEETGASMTALDEASRLEDALRLLASRRYDVVLLDLGLPDSQGLATLSSVLRAAGRAAIIVLTALDDRAFGVQAVQQGAQDYLVKGRLDAELLRRSMHYAVERKRVLLELERSNEDLTRFAYRVAHDFKSPLRTIVGFCQCIQEDQGEGLDESSAQYLAFTVDAGKRLSRLVDDLLHYAEVSYGNHRFALAHCGDALEEALGNLRELAEAKRARITCDSLPSVRGNSALLTELFQNLIENALKHCRASDPEIHVGAAEQDGEWVFNVADNGVGIPRDKQEKIFLAFERLAAEKDNSGSGIGLATCKSVVELHGGRIWVESEPGAGTRFLFTIPRPSMPAGAGEEKGEPRRSILATSGPPEKTATSREAR